MIQLRPAARNDVRKIAAYLTAKSLSPSVSQEFLTSFEATCLHLERWPKMGPRVEISPERHIRSVVVSRFSKYLIFYREIESGILIVRVLHGMRDLPLILSEHERK